LPFRKRTYTRSKIEGGPADEPASVLLLQTLHGIDGRNESMRISDLFGGRIKMGKGKMNEKAKKIEKDLIFPFYYYIHIFIYIRFFLFAV
jgi:hypothetical protein